MSGIKKFVSIIEAVDIPPPPIHFTPPAIVQHVSKPVGSFAGHYNANVNFDKPQQGGDITSKAAAYERKHEGSKNQLYKDSRNYWTIGIGHLVTAQELPHYKNRVLTSSEIESIFAKDLESKMHLINNKFGTKFNEYSDNLKCAIIDGYFRGDLPGSPKAIDLLIKGDFNGASIEYLNNKEYHNAKAKHSGVASRMEQNAAIMKQEAQKAVKPVPPTA